MQRPLVEKLSQPITGLFLNAAPLVEKLSQPIICLLLNAAPPSGEVKPTNYWSIP
jgi:hypothetical protein